MWWVVDAKVETLAYLEATATAKAKAKEDADSFGSRPRPGTAMGDDLACCGMTKKKRVQTTEILALPE